MSLLSRVLNHHSERSRSNSSPTSLASSASSKSPRFSLSISLESPPVVLYGQPHESTGSIISGLLRLDILDKIQRIPLEHSLSPVSSASSGDVDLELDSVVLLLVQTFHYTVPFVLPSNQVASCKDCATRKNTLARWDVLSETASFAGGSHAYPFSHLLPGLVAASSKIGLAQSHSFIKYDLIAVARAGSKETTVSLPLNILRLILRGPDRNSLRVFPPTEVTASAVLPSVMYPKSTFPIELRMDNVVSPKQDRRWRMRKLLWKIEEHTKIRASTCTKHLPKLRAIEDSHRKLQLYKTLKQGSPQGGSSDGPSRSTGLHYLSIQTLMFLDAPPTHGNAVSAVEARIQQDQVGNQDIVEEADDGESNRPDQEAAQFDQDFGNGPNQIQPIVSQSSNIHPVSSTRSQTLPPDKKDLFLDELRVIAHGDIKSGWKSDFLGKGRIELVAEISALDCSSGLSRHVSKASSSDAKQDEFHEGLRNDANISCDIEDPALGVYVNHVLVVEVVVAEELVQPLKIPKAEPLAPLTSISSVSSASTIGSSQVGVPTGAARVLRMQFKVHVTERSGLGIAWDDEVPPTYEDVRALSPPTYETLGAGTPVYEAGSSRPTPAVLYGLGDTPLMGSFANRLTQSIDEVADLDERVQEFRL